MALSSFLRQLNESGRIAVSSAGELSAVDCREADDVLRETDRLRRLEAPGTPPPLDVPAARWAATVLFRACQIVVDRDLGLERVVAEAQTRPFDAANAAVHGSVDLTFRFLPDLITLARRIAEGDPLVEFLRQLAAEWPLSSVGIDGIEVTNLDPILADDSLRHLYVDRLLACGAVDRLDAPAIRDEVKRALGVHAAQLAPRFAAKLDADLSNAEPKEEAPA